MKLFLLLLVCFTYQQGLLKNDFYLSFTDNSVDNSTIDTFTLWYATRGRFGYSFIVFTKELYNFTNSLIYVFYIKDEAAQVLQYRSIENLNIVQNVDFDLTLYNNTLFDYTNYPVGWWKDELELTIDITKSVFQSRFSDPFYVYLGTDYWSNPPNQTLNLTSLISIIDRQNLTTTTIVFNYPDRRVETLHPALYFLALIYYIFLFILLIIFNIFKKQPIYSRGFTPFLALFSHFLCLLPGFYVFYLTLESYSTYCNIWYYIQDPLIIVILFLCNLNFLRYSILLILNNSRKSTILDKMKINFKVNKLEWYLILLKHMGTWYFTLIVSVLVYGFMIILFSIQLGVYGCDGNIYYFGDYFYLGLLVLLFVCLFIQLIVDLIINSKRIFTCKFVEIWKEDILFFRVEFYIIGLFTFIFYIITTSIQIWWSNNYLTVNVPREATYDVVILTFNYNLFLFFQVEFSLIVTIIKFIIDLFQKKEISDGIQIKNMYNDDPEVWNLLKTYAQSEASVENCLVIEDIEKLLLEKDDEKKKILSKDIFYLYLNGSFSKLEINISGKLSSEIKMKINDVTTYNQLFKKVKDEVFLNLCDTFNRFALTKEYKEIKSKRQKIQDMLTSGK